MKEWIVRWFLGGIVREIAEGKKGEGPKRVYWWLTDRKRTWSALAGLFFAALVTFNAPLAEKWAGTFTFVLAVMVTIGIADKDWKKAAPLAEWVAPVQALMSAGPVLAGIVAFVVEFLPQVPNCASCGHLALEIQFYAGVVAAVTTWLAARLAPPPAFPARRAEDLKPS